MRKWQKGFCTNDLKGAKWIERTSRHSFWTLFVVFLIDEPQGSYSPVHGGLIAALYLQIWCPKVRQFSHESVHRQTDWLTDGQIDRANFILSTADAVGNPPPSPIVKLPQKCWTNFEHKSPQLFLLRFCMHLKMPVIFIMYGNVWWESVNLNLLVTCC